MLDLYCFNDFPIKVGPLKALDVATGKMSPVPSNTDVRMTLAASQTVHPPVSLGTGLEVTLTGNDKGEFFGGFDAADLNPTTLAAAIDQERYVIVWAAGLVREVIPVMVRHPRVGEIVEA